MAAQDFDTYYPPVAPVMPVAAIRRERMLPYPGDVLVHIDARVEPVTIVARATSYGRLRMVNLARALRVPPTRVEKLLQKKIGEPFAKGDVLALLETRWMRRAYRAPEDGQLLAVRDGQLLLESTPAPLELDASIKGIVTNIMPRFGVVIETVGAFIQGAWGTNREAYGVLRLVCDSRDKPLTADLIDVSAHAAIVVGGASVDAAALEQAAKVQVKGLIIGSMEATLRPIAEGLPCPVIVVEGFGHTAMSEPAFALFQQHNGREAALKGTTLTRGGARRPEIIIPAAASDDIANPPPLPLLEGLRVGGRVRVTQAPHAGQIGAVATWPPRTQVWEDAGRARAIEVVFTSGEKAWVPWTNVELMA